jgi:hypothetical protein
VRMRHRVVREVERTYGVARFYYHAFDHGVRIVGQSEKARGDEPGRSRRSLAAAATAQAQSRVATLCPKGFQPPVRETEATGDASQARA